MAFPGQLVGGRADRDGAVRLRRAVDGTCVRVVGAGLGGVVPVGSRTGHDRAVDGRPPRGHGRPVVARAGST